MPIENCHKRKRHLRGQHNPRKFSADCKILFNCEELRRLQVSTNAPTIFDFKIPQNKDLLPLTNISIELKSLDLNKIDHHYFKETSFDEENDGIDIYIPSIWTLLIYLAIATIVIFAAIKKFKRSKKVGSLQQ